MTFPFGETVTLIRRSITSHDADGNDIRGTLELSVDSVAWDPGTSSETVQGQDQVIQSPRFFFPAGTAIDPLDAVRRSNGKTYEVTGEPGDYSSPFTGWTPGVVVNVRRVAG